MKPRSRTGLRNDVYVSNEVRTEKWEGNVQGLHREMCWARVQVPLRWVKQFPWEVSCPVGIYGNYSGSVTLGLVWGARLSPQGLNHQWSVYSLLLCSTVLNIWVVSTVGCISFKNGANIENRLIPFFFPENSTTFIIYSSETNILTTYPINLEYS